MFPEAVEIFEEGWVSISSFRHIRKTSTNFIFRSRYSRARSSTRLRKLKILQHLMSVKRKSAVFHRTCALSVHSTEVRAAETPLRLGSPMDSGGSALSSPTQFPHGDYHAEQLT